MKKYIIDEEILEEILNIFNSVTVPVEGIGEYLEELENKIKSREIKND